MNQNLSADGMRRNNIFVYRGVALSENTHSKINSAKPLFAVLTVSSSSLISLLKQVDLALAILLTVSSLLDRV